MIKRRLGIVFCAISLVSIFWVASARAQVQGGGWSEPYRLSSSAGVASEASLVADQYGFVHCFWTETLFENQQTIIQYARFDGDTWTNPNDIILPTAEIENISPAVDQHGILHIIWTEGLTGPVYYSQAPANNAQSANNWTTPVRLPIPGGIVRLRIDSKGIFHVLYINRGEELGVYYTHSEDQGTTWSEPRWLDPDIPLDYTPASLNFEIDENDGLHVAWSYGSLINDAQNYEMVRYIHSLDGGNTWSLPFTIDQYIEGIDHDLAFAEPRMIVQGQTVHVIWAAGDHPYRHHRYSSDAGQTWSAPSQIFGELHGQAFDGLTVDGAGRVHFFGQIRYPIGIYHAYWDRSQWTPPALIYLIAQEDSLEGIGDRIHAHFTVPVVRAGNQVVLTFTDGPADPKRRLFVMVQTMNDIPPIDPMPTPISTATQLPKPSPTPEPPTPLPSPTATRPVFDTSTQPMTRTPQPDLVIWVTLVPNFLLFGTIFFYKALLKLKFRKPPVNEKTSK